MGAERLHDLLLEVLLTPPPPASASRPDVSPSVDAALACAPLAKRPADRASNLIDWAEALAADLRTLTAVVDVKGWDVHRVRDTVRGPVDTNAVTTLGDVDTRTRMSWE